MPDGLIATSDAGQSTSERMMRVGGIPVSLDALAKQAGGIVESTLLEPDDGQAQQGVKMALVCLEHGCVELLRLPESSLLMKRDRSVKDLQRIDHSRIDWR